MKFNILALSVSVLGLSLAGISSPASALGLSDFVSYDFASSFNQSSYQTAAFSDNYDYADSVLSNFQAPAKSYTVNKSGDAVLTSKGQTAYRNYVSQVGSYAVDQSEFASQLYANDYMKKNPNTVFSLAGETDTSYLNNIVKSTSSSVTNPLAQYASSNFNVGSLSSGLGSSFSSSNLTNLSGFSGSNLLSGVKVGSTISTALGGSSGSSILTTLGSGAGDKASSSLKGLAASFANYDSFLDFKNQQATKNVSSYGSGGGSGGLGGLLGGLSGSVNIGGIKLSGGLSAGGLTGSASLCGLNLGSGGLGSSGLSGGLSSGLTSGLTNRVTSGVTSATSGLSSGVTSAIAKENALRSSGLLSRF